MNAHHILKILKNRGVLDIDIIKQFRKDLFKVKSHDHSKKSRTQNEHKGEHEKQN